MRIALGIIALAALSGCGNDVATWTEQVVLADGQVVLLDRRAERKPRSYFTRERGPLESWEFCYVPRKIYWKSSGDFRPSHFEMVGDKAFAKVPLHVCATCQAAGNPPDSTAYFAHRGGKWERIPAAEFPDKRWKNLIEIGVFDTADPDKDIAGSITVAEKWKRDPINEESRIGQAVKEDQRGSCPKCQQPIATDPQLKLEPQSAPSGSFCK